MNNTKKLKTICKSYLLKSQKHNDIPRSQTTKIWKEALVKG